MIKWHKKKLDKFMKIFGLNTYQVSWISYIKGIVTAIIVYEFII